MPRGSVRVIWVGAVEGERGDHALEEGGDAEVLDEEGVHAGGGDLGEVGGGLLRARQRR